MSRVNRRIALVLILLINIVCIFCVGDKAMYVIIPALLTANIFLLFAIILWNRNSVFPFFDVGFFCILSTFVYTVYPIINYLFDGLQFGILADSRLAALNISPQELGGFHYRHVLYIFCTSIAYLSVRNSNPIIVGNIAMPKSKTLLSVSFFFILLTLYFFFLKIIFGLNFNSSYEAKSYADNLRALANAPLFLVQLSTKLTGVLFLFKLAFLYFVIGKLKSKRWKWFLVIWVAYEIIDAVLLKGSRSNLMFFLIGSALLYHRMVKEFNFRSLFLSGGLIFILFIFLGIYRFYTDLNSLQGDLSESESGIFSAGNEFQALLGTSYDILTMRENGNIFPSYLYMNDFISILPPQQLLPFEKVEASEWYLRQLGINGTGVGFMWGVVSQALVGFDWFELAFRGFLLGFLLGLFHNYYVKKQRSFFLTLFYVYMCLRVYYTFRDTTFSPLAFVVWEVIPFYFLIKIGNSIFNRQSSRQISK